MCMCWCWRICIKASTPRNRLEMFVKFQAVKSSQFPQFLLFNLNILIHGSSSREDLNWERCLTLCIVVKDWSVFINWIYMFYTICEKFQRELALFFICWTKDMCWLILSYPWAQYSLNLISLYSINISYSSLQNKLNSWNKVFF